MFKRQAITDENPYLSVLNFLDQHQNLLAVVLAIKVKTLSAMSNGSQIILNPNLKNFIFLLPYIYCLKLPTSPTNSQKLAMFKTLELNAIGLHWAIKLTWDKKHRVPGKKTKILTMQPYGEFFKQMFILCEKCHGRQRSVNAELPYTNAEEWFHRLYWEWLEIDFIQDFFSFQTTDISQPTDSSDVNTKTKSADKKRFVTRNCRRVWHQAYYQLENPFTGNTKHLSTLIDTAISLSKSSPVFKSEDYKAFIDAAMKMIDMFESPNFMRHVSKNNELYYQRSGSKATDKVKYLTTQRLAEDSTILNQQEFEQLESEILTMQEFNFFVFWNPCPASDT